MIFWVEPPLACPDFPDPFQEFVEVVFPETFSLLQTFIIRHKALDDKLLQGLRRPNPELSRLIAVDPVPNGDDGVEVIESGLIAFPIGGSCFQNGNN